MSGASSQLVSDGAELRRRYLEVSERLARLERELALERLRAARLEVILSPDSTIPMWGTA